mgnify:CR=1 FL=1
MMGQPIFWYAGVRVHTSALCVANYPIKEHVKSRTQSETYHLRIQKKWNKRFGFERRPTAYQVGGVIFAHPDIVDKLKGQASVI